MTKKVQHFLSIDKVQRIIYFISIALWTCIWLFEDLQPYSDKTLDIVWAIPALLLLIQTILNSKTIWRIIFSATAIYSFLITISSAFYFITIADLSFTDFLKNLIPVIFFASNAFIIYKIKPVQSQRFMLKAIIEL